MRASYPYRALLKILETGTFVHGHRCGRVGPAPALTAQRSNHLPRWTGADQLSGSSILLPVGSPAVAVAQLEPRHRCRAPSSQADADSGGEHVGQALQVTSRPPCRCPVVEGVGCGHEHGGGLVPVPARRELIPALTVTRSPRWPGQQHVHQPTSTAPSSSAVTSRANTASAAASSGSARVPTVSPAGASSSPIVPSSRVRLGRFEVPSRPHQKRCKCLFWIGGRSRSSGEGGEGGEVVAGCSWWSSAGRWSRGIEGGGQLGATVLSSRGGRGGDGRRGWPSGQGAEVERGEPATVSRTTLASCSVIRVSVRHERHPTATPPVRRASPRPTRMADRSDRNPHLALVGRQQLDRPHSGRNPDGGGGLRRTPTRARATGARVV